MPITETKKVDVENLKTPSFNCCIFFSSFEDLKNIALEIITKHIRANKQDNFWTLLNWYPSHRKIIDSHKWCTAICFWLWSMKRVGNEVYSVGNSVRYLSIVQSLSSRANHLLHWNENLRKENKGNILTICLYQITCKIQ